MGGRVLLKAAAILIALGYCSLLAYQGVATYNVEETRPVPEPETRLTLDRNKSSNHSKITLDDVFIAVKTSKYFVHTRLPLILRTWYQLAKNQTWFFTDIDSRKLTYKTNSHMINTNCSATHQRKHLCCKTSVEFDYYLNSGKKWFCHFDDDNYVNVPRLVTTLQRYNHLRDWYLGKTSVKSRVSVIEKVVTEDVRRQYKSSKFWFATGGAGYCISRSLALKMSPIAGGGKFISVCERIRLPDDVTMGYIIENVLHIKLTEVQKFHSHLERLEVIAPNKLKDQISFSYNDDNVVSVPGFDEQYDPTRFLSLHCFLFPNSFKCPR